MSVNRIQAAIQWLVDYQWFCVVAFAFLSHCISVMNQKKTKKQKRKKNENKKEDEKIEPKTKRILLLEGVHSRLACVIFHLD